MFLRLFSTSNRRCNVVRYCAKRSRGREPVRWSLFDGTTVDVMEWEVRHPTDVRRGF